MLSFERRKTICEIIEQHGRADIAELVKRFGVSAETIRKDLILLESNGRLRRVHGGAIPYGGSVPLLDLSQRIPLCIEQKRELCRYTCRFINNGDSIFIDTGSTTNELADLLAEKFDRLHIITAYAPFAERLGKVKGFEVIMCGGLYEPKEKMFYGSIAVDTLRQLHVSKAFICPSAVSINGGAFCNIYPALDIMKTAADISDTVYLLADSEKLEKSGNFRIFATDRAEAVITDSSVSDDICNIYDEHGIRLIRK